MKLFLKIIGYTFAGIVGLLVIAFIALQLISDEQYKKWLTGAAESVTGRTLAVDGELDVQIGPTLGLTARDVRFANAEWGSREDMVRADRLLAQLHVLSLFKGVLDVTLELDGPDILMETDGDGTGNWVFGTGAPQQELP
ncbi:MAG: AsmA family protein, partial [Desulfofustis sp.]|nr:AsmA family protein [Desulfofustis sp.]